MSIYQLTIIDGQQELTVKGERDPQDPLYKWKKWYKVERDIPLPKVF